MKDQTLDRLEQQFLEALVFADRAQTAMRCFGITHSRFMGVADMDEHLALREEGRRTTEERHEANLAMPHQNWACTRNVAAIAAGLLILWLARTEALEGFPAWRRLGST